MRRTLPVVVVLGGLLALAGCGSSQSPDTDPSASSPTGSASPSATPECGSTTVDTAPKEWSGASVPKITGAYGAKPTLTFTTTDPPTDLSRAVLSEGDGAVVKSCDLVAVDYLGQIYGGKVFDNSYDRKAPAAFGIGVGQVVAGWDDGLVGMKVGSRVLLSIPPALGYGPDGNSDAGITGTDTLVFVVDIVAAYPQGSAGQADAKAADAPPAGITVGGELGKKPTIEVAKGTAEPTAAAVTVIAKGTGEKLPEGLAVIQYTAVDWDGNPVESSWDSGTPAGVSISADQKQSVFDKLVGVPVGSRAVLELPKSSSGGPYAVVVDVVAHVPTAAEAAKAG